MNSNIDIEGLLSFIHKSFIKKENLSLDDVLHFVNDSLLAEDIIRSYKNLIDEKSYIKNGKFIVVSGIDKSGKETQAISGTGCVKPLRQFLVEKGFNVMTILQPSYDTRLGSLIKYYLTESKKTIKPAWMLWSLDRAQHKEKIIEWLSNLKPL